MGIPARLPEMTWVDIIDRDHVSVWVDGEREIFSRSDRYRGHPKSGAASFGGVSGDWRMIRDIADDIAEAFRQIDNFPK
jgi:hypothetical protein